jgi:hypothetical protein
MNMTRPSGAARVLRHALGLLGALSACTPRGAGDVGIGDGGLAVIPDDVTAPRAAGDAGTGDGGLAVIPDDVTFREGPGAALLAPLSTATVTSRTPTLRWVWLSA